jgi:transposase
MIIHPGFIGIDVSKANLDVFDARIGQQQRFANAAVAIAELLEPWKGTDVFVLFEATGHYDTALRGALVEAKIPFTRVNPARARDFARAAGFLAKTDAIDAKMLAAMAQCLRPTPCQPADLDRERLARLQKRRDQLVAMRQQERTRAHDCACPDTSADIARHLAWLDSDIDALQTRIKALIAACPRLDTACQLMRTVPGVGPVTAATLLALVPELGARSPKTIAALAGLAPFNVDSGKFRGMRRIGGGRKRVRDALYMAAVAASRSKSRFAAFYQTLRQAGKPPKLAFIALARKILTTLNAILRDQIAFKPG